MATLKGKVIIFDGVREKLAKSKATEAGAQLVPANSVIVVRGEDSGKVKSLTLEQFKTKYPVVTKKVESKRTRKVRGGNNMEYVIDEGVANFVIIGEGIQHCQELHVSIKSEKPNFLLSLKAYLDAHSKLINAKSIRLNIPIEITRKLKKGAVVKMRGIDFERNKGIFGIWDGTTLLKLQHEYYDDGFIPHSIDAITLDVPKDYWRGALPHDNEVVWLKIGNNPKVKVEEDMEGKVYMFNSGGNEYAFHENSIPPLFKGWNTVPISIHSIETPSDFVIEPRKKSLYRMRDFLERFSKK